MNKYSLAQKTVPQGEAMQFQSWQSEEVYPCRFANELCFILGDDKKIKRYRQKYNQNTTSAKQREIKKQSGYSGYGNQT